MPPKKQQPNKKTEQKKKEKIIEDKTFGLKNKKGQKNQKYIQHVTKQVQQGNQKASRMDEMQQSKSKLKDEKKKEQEELNKLFRPVTAAQKVAKGVDPKSVVCAFFKQGQCKKGDKCKFSHDLAMQRKAEKKSMYEDERDEKENDTMDNWDEAKLQDVVKQKHGEAEIKQPKTDKVCKFFLQAIEDCKYGWFWICPNGGDKCMYKHALPAGFVLKKNKKADEEEEEKISLEELIEDERAKLASNNLTKLTLESFTAWKKRKIAEKKKNFEESMNKKKNDFKQGKALGLSGREVFEFKPELADADDEGADDTKYVREVEESEEGMDTGPVKEITLESIGGLATEVDNTGTIAKSSQDKENKEPVGATKSNTLPGITHVEDESSKLGVAGALPTSDTTQVNGVPIDEGVFDAEDVPVDEDLFTNELDDLDEDLDELDIDD